MKRFLVLGCLVAAITLATAQCAFAARIYDYLPVTIGVVGTTVGARTQSIVIRSGERSDSLGWSHANGVAVSVNGANVCALYFGIHAEIQGGNYMTVGHQGNRIVCTVCNASHGVIASAGGNVGNAWDIRKTPSSRTGC